MKKLFFTCVILCMALPGMAQFVPQPLNYPAPGYWPYYYSIVDANHVWIGTFHEFGSPYSTSVKTTDGGNSWIFDPIPVAGSPGCVSICGWDANTCFHVYVDHNQTVDPSVWKTTDGGATWSNLITTQFTGSFINFYHAFSADTGLAMGDPRDGYFEIQRTTDGGATWSRLPATDIPAPLPGEMGLNHSYSAIGNSIWFTTSKVRCYRSTNRGQTWEVTAILPNSSLDMGVCFSSELKGVYWNRGATTNQIVVTTDGGITWDTAAFPTGYIIMDMCRVPGFDGGFVVTAYKNSTRVYFTPDLFNTLQTVQASIMSTGAVEFYDASTGWLGAGESGSNEIYKFSGVLTSAREAMDNPASLRIIPNPSGSEALVKLPAGMAGHGFELRITDLSGRVISRISLPPATGWTKLNAPDYSNGIYLLEVFSGNTRLTRERWVVFH